MRMHLLLSASFQLELHFKLQLVKSLQFCGALCDDEYMCVCVCVCACESLLNALCAYVGVRVCAGIRHKVELFGLN